MLVSEHSIQGAQAGRQERLRTAFSTLGLDAVLINHEIDIRYLTGFIGHDSLLLVDSDDSVIVSDFRYDEQLNPIRQNGLCSVEIGIRHRLDESIQRLCAERGIKSLGVQEEFITVAQKKRFQKSLGTVKLVDTAGLVGGLRMKKDAIEAGQIERSAQLAEEALNATIKQLSLGMTEHELCALLEYEMKRRGASGASFDPIIAVGPNGSLPHYETGQTKLEANTSLLIDWGATLNWYNSDLTRTFGIGSMPAKVREIYQIVLDAQLKAIDAIRPGRTCAEIDAVARDHITRAGYGERFGHGLGHGLGMQTHESPYFNQLSTDTLLEPGMVMTVEPGIYLPGIGGVRIEDDIIVTDNGCRVLSTYPKDLDSALLDLPAGA